MDSLITDLSDDDIETVWPQRVQAQNGDDDATDEGGQPDGDADGTDADDDASDADDDASDADQDGTDA